MNAGQHAAPQTARFRKALRDIALFVGAVALLTWTMCTFVYQAFGVPTGSMESTIMTGDQIFAEKVSYHFREPEPGDIIAFADPEVPGRTLLKRCIAVGGQTVDLVDGHVVVDGIDLSEPYTNGLPSNPLPLAYGVDIAYPYTVPQDHLWVMGDNRTNSNDSRYFGAVPASSVIARGVMVYWPIDDLGLLE